MDAVASSGFLGTVRECGVGFTVVGNWLPSVICMQTFIVGTIWYLVVGLKMYHVTAGRALIEAGVSMFA